MKEKTNERAASLEEILSEIEQGNTESKRNLANNKKVKKELEAPKIDVLELPSRNEIHGNNNNRTKLKVSKPFSRLLFVILTLLIIGVGTYLLWGNDLITIINKL